MNPLLESLTGTAALTDQVVASDLLSAAKSGVWNYAIALTETGSAEVRSVLRTHLGDAIAMHEQVSEYMMERGWYNPYSVEKQLNLDVANAEIAIDLT